jgi:hypothetical protein
MSKQFMTKAIKKGPKTEVMSFVKVDKFLARVQKKDWITPSLTDICAQTLHTLHVAF